MEGEATVTAHVKPSADDSSQNRLTFVFPLSFSRMRHKSSRKGSEPSPAECFSAFRSVKKTEPNNVSRRF